MPRLDVVETCWARENMLLHKNLHDLFAIHITYTLYVPMYYLYDNALLGVGVCLSVCPENFFGYI